MKKFAIISGLVVAGIVIAQGGSSGSLAGHVKALADAQALSASMTYQTVGGSQGSFKIDLAKPGMSRIERGNELIVADGKTITVYDKYSNSYSKKPQTDADLNLYFNEDEMNLLAPFFDAKAFDKFAKVTDAGTKNRKGMTMNVVEVQVDKKGLKTATYYVDPSTKLVRQIQFTMTDGPAPVQVLVDAKELTISKEVDADLFAFKAPAGSHELTPEEMASDKWFTDLTEAKAEAKKTKRLLMVDFYADW